MYEYLVIQFFFLNLGFATVIVCSVSILYCEINTKMNQLNQIEQLCSLAADTQISVKNFIKLMYDVISENNRKMLTSANRAK